MYLFQNNLMSDKEMEFIKCSFTVNGVDDWDLIPLGGNDGILSIRHCA
jgi:hypothetical protein